MFIPMKLKLHTVWISEKLKVVEMLSHFLLKYKQVVYYEAGYYK